MNKALKMENNLAFSHDMYSQMDLELMEHDFMVFCQKFAINYEKCCEIGVDECINLLKRYVNDELDGSMCEKDCELLYDIVDDPWGCSNLKRHEITADILKSEVEKINIIPKRLLILGGGSGGEFNHLKSVFPHSEYYITDISKIALNKLHEKIKKMNDAPKQINFQVFDVFDNSSLEIFAKNNPKFDIILASGVYRYGNGLKTRQNSARFMLYSLLNPNGLFMIVEVQQDAALDSPYLIEDQSPIYDQQIKTPNRINPTQFTIYQNKKRT